MVPRARSNIKFIRTSPGLVFIRWVISHNSSDVFANSRFSVEHIPCVNPNNRCCSRQAITITYSECVCVALGIQHAMRMRRILICGLPGTKIFSFHAIPYTARFSKKKCYWKTKCVFWFSLRVFVWNISHSKKNSVRYDQKCLLVFV